MFRRLAAQIRQYFFDLYLFLDLQFPKLVVQFHHGGRLDEESGSCGGLVVYHTVYLSFVFRFYGDTVSVVPHGDHGVLQIGAQRTVYHRI